MLSLILADPILPRSEAERPERGRLEHRRGRARFRRGRNHGGRKGVEVQSLKCTIQQLCKLVTCTIVTVVDLPFSLLPAWFSKTVVYPCQGPENPVGLGPKTL